MHLSVKIYERPGKNIFQKISLHPQRAHGRSYLWLQVVATVYRLLADGIHRPGEMVRRVEGLSPKVLNECLRKNCRFGIIERIAYHESTAAS